MSLNVHVFLLCLVEHVLYARPRVARETLRVLTSLQRHTGLTRSPETARVSRRDFSVY